MNVGLGECDRIYLLSRRHNRNEFRFSGECLDSFCFWEALAGKLYEKCYDPDNASQWQVVRRTLIWACFRVFVRYRDVAMTKSISYDRERRLAIDGVRAMAMPEPVWRNLEPVQHTSMFSCLSYDAEDGGRVEARPLIMSLARDFLARLEYKIIIRCTLAYSRKDSP